MLLQMAQEDAVDDSMSLIESEDVGKNTEKKG
jgi:hypothetical protein